MCPNCQGVIDLNVTANKYFLGFNSAKLPFFKCAHCGSIFYLHKNQIFIADEHKGYRFVPIVTGIVSGFVAFGIFIISALLETHGIIRVVFILIGTPFLALSWSCLKTGIFGSQELIDELTLDKSPLSENAEKEWEKINK